MTEAITVQFQPEDPYPDHAAMIYDVTTHGRLKVYATRATGAGATSLRPYTPSQ